MLLTWTEELSDIYFVFDALYFQGDLAGRSHSDIVRSSLLDLFWLIFAEKRLDLDQRLRLSLVVEGVGTFFLFFDRDILILENIALSLVIHGLDPDVSRPLAFRLTFDCGHWRGQVH